VVPAQLVRSPGQAAGGEHGKGDGDGEHHDRTSARRVHGPS
jgi:hypothetical protein